MFITIRQNFQPVCVISNGNAESEIIPELQIVDEATFRRAQELMEKRTTHHADTPLNLRGSSLLVGNIFCGHCKNRLTLTTSGKKYIRKDGTDARPADRADAGPGRKGRR